jgi:hypothetical protein
MPTGVKPGDLLLGGLVLDGGDKHPRSFPLTCAVAPKAIAAKASDAVEEKVEPPPFNVQHQLRDAQIKWLASLKDDNQRDEGYAAVGPALLKSFPFASFWFCFVDFFLLTNIA